MSGSTRSGKWQYTVALETLSAIDSTGVPVRFTTVEVIPTDPKSGIYVALYHPGNPFQSLTHSLASVSGDIASRAGRCSPRRLPLV